VKNVKAVLGPNPLLWFRPTVPPGDRLSYEIVQGEPSPTPSTALRILTHTPLQMGNIPANGHLKIPLRGWTKTAFLSSQRTRGRMAMDLSTQTFILVPWTMSLGNAAGRPLQGNVTISPTMAKAERRRGFTPSLHTIQTTMNRSPYSHFSQPPHTDEGEDVHSIDREEMMRQYVKSQSQSRSTRQGSGEGQP